eukprot:5860699-Amphidinium_carterae.1
MLDCEKTLSCQRGQPQWYFAQRPCRVELRGACVAVSVRPTLNKTSRRMCPRTPPILRKNPGSDSCQQCTCRWAPPSSLVECVVAIHWAKIFVTKLPCAL